MLGSYKKGLNNNNYISLEKFSFDYYSDYHDLNNYEDMITIYNIYISNYEEIIINGKLGIYILNSYQWEIKKQIIFSNHLMENVLYLNDSFFLIFLRKYIYLKKNVMKISK